MKFERRYIRVYDKTGKLIAIFDNTSNANKNEVQRNLMSNPIVEIESNGASTLSFQMLSNSEKWQQIKHPENVYECGGKYYTALSENSFVYDDLTVNVTLVETWYLLKKVFLQAHNVDTSIEAMDEHTVKILPKTDPKFRMTVNGVAYDDSQIRDSRGVLMPRGSAGYALWGILKGTDWSLGVCDLIPKGFDPKNDYGTFNVETDMKSALENIQFIQELYGGILVWDSKNKTCSLRDETKEGSDFNTWKGFEIRKNKNLASVPQITIDNDITTRLYPLGNGNLNIKRVNGGKGYVDNFSFTNAIRCKYIQNADIHDTNDEGGQKTLKFWAEKELAKLCKPRRSIKYNIIDLRATPGFEHEQFDVNDIVKAYFPDTETGKEIFEFVRIQRIKYNYFFPSSESEVDVGDKVANETELFLQIYKNMNSSAHTDANGHLSGDDVWTEVPEKWICDEEGNITSSSSKSLNQSISLIAEKHTESTDAIAGLKIYADETFATVESFTSFEKKTDDAISKSNTRISQVSNDLGAQITLEASHYSETKQGISNANASINVVANNLQAEVTSRTQFETNINGRVSEAFTEISQVSDKAQSAINITAGFNNKVAGIEIKVNDQGSEIRLKADKTYVDNLVAGYVKTNELDADVASLGYSKIKKADIDSIVSSIVDSEYFKGKNISTRGLDAESINTRAFATSSMSLGGERIGWKTISVPQSASYNSKTGNVTLYNNRTYYVLG